CLTKDAHERYALTPESATFLVSTKPSFYGSFFKHISGQTMPKWLELTEVVGTGRPARAVNQEQSGAEFFQGFVAALFPLGYPAAQALAKALDLEHAAQQPVRVLDLAAGSGVWGIALAQAGPDVEVTAVDWAGVMPGTGGR